MDFDVTSILSILITVLGTVITGFLIPWLKSKTNDENWITITSWAQTFVKCAEQIYNDQGGEQKKQYVYTRLQEELNKLGIKFSEEELNAAIEEAVFNLTGGQLEIIENERIELN